MYSAENQKFYYQGKMGERIMRTSIICERFKLQINYPVGYNYEWSSF